MDDLQEIKRKFAAALSEDEVLELIKGWAPEKRLQGLSPEDLVKGLSPEERARLRQLLSQ